MSRHWPPEGYRKVDFAKLSKPQEHFWKTYFQRELFPLLSPQIVDSRHPFPFLNNKDIYYIAQLHTKNEGVSYGIVPVSSQFERVLFVKDGETAASPLWKSSSPITPPRFSAPAP